MDDENELLQLRKKNRKLKSKIWNDYRNFSDDLRMLKHQKKSLQNSIQIEQNKNRELIQHFTNKIAQLQEQLRQVSSFTPPISSTFSVPASKKKKDNFKWRFQELEEEGKALQLDTEKTFKKCREASPLKFYFTDIPPVSNYVFDYPPIIISPPQPLKSHKEYLYVNEDDRLSTSSSSSLPHDIQVSPIFTSHDRNKKNRNNKKKENNSSNSSTVSVKHNSSQSDDSNSINDSNDEYDSPPLESLKNQNEKFNLNKDKYKSYDSHSQDNIKQLSSQHPVESQTKITQSRQNAQFSPPHIEIPNKVFNDNNKKQTSQTNEIKNSQLPSPIHIKTHIDDDSETNFSQSLNKPNNDTHKPIFNQETKQQNDAQIIKPAVQNPNSVLAGFVSQSNWEDDDDEDNEVVFDQEEIGEIDKENKVNNISGGIPSDTNPILDTSDQHKSPLVSKQEIAPSQTKETNTTVKTNSQPKTISPSGSLTSKNSYDFDIDINDIEVGDMNEDNNFW